MIFKVTKAENGLTTGEVFFSVPVMEEICKANKLIADMCRARAAELYKGTGFSAHIIEAELKAMERTNTAYRFLVLKEIVELSREQGYPVLIPGNLSHSAIAYLLGITETNPFNPHYRCENRSCSFSYEEIKDVAFGVDGEDKYCSICGQMLVKDGFGLSLHFAWGDTNEPSTPDFSIYISESIRKLLPRRLDDKFSSVKTDDEVYNRISVTESKLCNTLGELYKKTGLTPSNKKYCSTIYSKVLRYLAEEITDSENICQCNFHYLCRAEALSHAGLDIPKSAKSLEDKSFFVTRDELLNELTYVDIPLSEALDIVKRGVWSMGEKRENYIERLSAAGLDEEFLENFKNTKNLWLMGACITRIQQLCDAEWYKSQVE